MGELYMRTSWTQSGCVKRFCSSCNYIQYKAFGVFSYFGALVSENPKPFAPFLNLTVYDRQYGQSGYGRVD